MPAAVATTVTAAQMIGFRENHPPAGVKIKISGLDVTAIAAIRFRMEAAHPLTRRDTTLSPTGGEGGLWPGEGEVRGEGVFHGQGVRFESSSHTRRRGRPGSAIPLTLAPAASPECSL
jgi:hypothetical protein